MSFPVNLRTIPWLALVLVLTGSVGGVAGGTASSELASIDDDLKAHTALPAHPVADLRLTMLEKKLDDMDGKLDQLLVSRPVRSDD